MHIQHLRVLSPLILGYVHFIQAVIKCINPTSECSFAFSSLGNEICHVAGKQERNTFTHLVNRGHFHLSVSAQN